MVSKREVSSEKLRHKNRELLISHPLRCALLCTLCRAMVCIFVLFLAIVPFLAQAQDLELKPSLPGAALLETPRAIVLNAKFASVDLRNYLEVFEDSQQLSIFEVQLPQTSFKHPKSAALDLSHEPYWLRFRVKTDATTPRPVLLEINTVLADRVEVYRLNRPLEPLTSAYPVEVSQRPYPDRRIVFPLLFGSQTEEWIYVRITTRFARSLSAQLYSSPAFSQDNAQQNMLNGIYFGIVIALIIYNLMLFYSFRDRVYF